MPRNACLKCGATCAPGETYCARDARPNTNKQRDYRGTAVYRKVRKLVLERDQGICHICLQPGADEIDHTPIPYRDLPRDATGKVPIAIALDPTNLKAAHGARTRELCNQKKG